MKTMNKVISLLIIWTVFTSTASAYSISGYVINNSVGISGAYVYYNSTEYNYSNSSGYYVLNNMTNGYKIINVSKDPTHYINSSNISISGNTIRNITLNIKPTGTITGCVFVFGGINPCEITQSTILSSNRIRWWF